MFLKYNDYVPQGLELEVGKSTRLFHCKPGGDNNKLYVTKRNDGCIVAFCHHCGKKGKYTPLDNDKSMETIIEEATKYLETSIDYGEISEDQYDGKLPSDTEFRWGYWHPLAKSWVLKYGLHPKEIHKHEIGYDSTSRRIILPVRTRMGTLQGYISRKLFTDGSDKYPKYLIHKMDNFQIFKQCTGPQDCNPFVCVITEDILSAIKCARYVDSYSILGVNLPNRLLRDLKFYRKVLIFLDNDNDIVRQKQLDMQQKILQFTDKCVIIESDKDPKEHSDEELRRLLE